MRILITGARGLIGRHVVALAAQTDGMEVIATSRTRPEILPKDIAFVPADLSSAPEATALVRSEAPTHIVHAAWETTHPTYWEDPVNLQWAEAAGAMAEALADVGGQRFVQVGTCAEYDWSHELCVEEVTPDRPTTRYGDAKLEAFRLIEAAAREKFTAAEARIFWVFGPGENPSRLIPLICRSYLTGRVPELGSGRQKRDLLFVKDAASAILRLATTNGTDGVVNIARGEEVQLGEVVTVLADLAGVTETGLDRHADPPRDPSRLVASADRIRATGWKPRHTLREGLAMTLDWWAQRGAQ